MQSEPRINAPDAGNLPAALAPLLIDDITAARLLGVSRSTVHRLRAAGRFPAAVKLGRALRFRRDELAAWVAAGCPTLDVWKAMREAEKKTDWRRRAPTAGVRIAN